MIDMINYTQRNDFLCILDIYYACEPFIKIILILKVINVVEK